MHVVTVDEPLLETSCTLGEGCIWDARKQRLYFLDIENRKVFTYEPASGVHGYQLFEKRITALALLDDDSGLLATAEDGPVLIPFSSLPFPPTAELMRFKRLEVKFELPSGFNRFNEACVDPTGSRFLCGTMMHEQDFPGKPGSTLHSLQLGPDGTFIAPVVEQDVTVSNGMGWSEDGKIMYFTDSLRQVIKMYDYDKTSGKMSNRRVFSDIVDHAFPDGMCQDDQYGIWSARWGSSEVLRFTPDGQLDMVVKFPRALNMTCCIFGANLDELYVTSAGPGENDDAALYPHTGHIFVAKNLGFRGKERTRFNRSLPVEMVEN